MGKRFLKAQLSGKLRFPMVTIWLFLWSVTLLPAQDTLTFRGQVSSQDTLTFRGQLSAWGAVNADNELPVWLGGRTISQANYEVKAGRNLLDAEASLNLGGSLGMSPFDTFTSEGKVKPYRAWARFSGRQFEVRAGLQKINFGSATMLRPLMWFDQLDPRDPLQLTDGVWGVLGRVYFLNNANIWLWGLYGNKGPKTWEIGNTSYQTPEFGGRIQMPAASGEAALSYHFRKADVALPGLVLPGGDKIPEHRWGLDGKWDVGIGLWAESSWIHKTRSVGVPPDQHFLTLGADYTFPLGNGINAVAEHLMTAIGEKPFEFAQKTSFSALSLGYPLGLSTRITAIVYRQWPTHKQFNFVNFQKQFRNIHLYLMAFINPDDAALPQQSGDNTLFLGKGAQVMVVYNY